LISFPQDLYITGRFGKNGNPVLQQAIEKILEGQSVESLKKVYEKLKDNPLVKWKCHIRKALGLPLPGKPKEWPTD